MAARDLFNFPHCEKLMVIEARVVWCRVRPGTQPTVAHRADDCASAKPRSSPCMRSCTGLVRGSPKSRASAPNAYGRSCDFSASSRRVCASAACGANRSGGAQTGFQVRDLGVELFDLTLQPLLTLEQQVDHPIAWIMNGVSGHNGAYRAMPTLCKDLMSALDTTRNRNRHTGIPLVADFPWVIDDRHFPRAKSAGALVAKQAVTSLVSFPPQRAHAAGSLGNGLAVAKRHQGDSRS